MRAGASDLSTVAFERVVGTAECYMIPRSDGRLLIGATVDDVGFRTGPTPAGLAWLINAAVAVVPGVASLPILETWAGYRPGTPDDWLDLSDEAGSPDGALNPGDPSIVASAYTNSTISAVRPTTTTLYGS